MKDSELREMANKWGNPRIAKICCLRVSRPLHTGETQAEAAKPKLSWS